jgi:uncharacterized protein YjiS (DUF1127 family)
VVAGGKSTQQELAMLTQSTAADSCAVLKDVDPHGITIRRLFRAVATWRLRHLQRAQLYALDDRNLQDIGISRWEIEAIVNSPNRDASGRIH